MIGLVTGFQPFAGLPTNPAEMLLRPIDGLNVEGIDIVAHSTPVSYRALPGLLAELVAEHRPAFMMGIGLAPGAPVMRVEKVAINAADFGVADNEGANPTGERFATGGNEARFATWDAAAVVEEILDAGVPARTSYHAGTHLCNLTLYTSLGALRAAGLDAPCGFLHVPYTPEQVVWMMRQPQNHGAPAPGIVLDQPSMALETQVLAVKAALRALARQALRDRRG
jgi:pyroglutamyl-peptidase